MAALLPSMNRVIALVLFLSSVIGVSGAFAQEREVSGAGYVCPKGWHASPYDGNLYCMDSRGWPNGRVIMNVDGKVRIIRNGQATEGCGNWHVVAGFAACGD